MDSTLTDEEKTTVRDEITKVIVQVQPNIKYKELVSLVNSFEVALQSLHELQAKEDKQK